MLKTEYLEQRIHQIVYDAFFEGADLALGMDAIDSDVFAHSTAKLELLRLISEIIMSDDD